MLARSRRIDLKRSLRSFFGDLFSNPAYQELELTAEQVYLADEIALHHDPFDALICAAALSLGLPLITRDGNIEDSGSVTVVW